MRPDRNLGTDLPAKVFRSEEVKEYRSEGAKAGMEAMAMAMETEMAGPTAVSLAWPQELAVLAGRVLTVGLCCRDLSASCRPPHRCRIQAYMSLLRSRYPKSPCSICTSRQRRLHCCCSRWGRPARGRAADCLDM